MFLVVFLLSLTYPSSPIIITCFSLTASFFIIPSSSRNVCERVHVYACVPEVVEAERAGGRACDRDIVVIFEASTHHHRYLLIITAVNHSRLDVPNNTGALSSLKPTSSLHSVWIINLPKALWQTIEKPFSIQTNNHATDHTSIPHAENC